MNKGKAMLFLLMATIVMLVTSQAFAHEIWLPYKGTSMIGIDSVYANAVLGLSKDGGKTCKWYILGWAGLDSDTEINGTSDDDVITVVGVNKRWCGVTLYKLIPNQYDLDIYGHDGDDGLTNHVGKVSLFGGDGDDLLYSTMENTYDYMIHGGDGDDILVVYNYGAAFGGYGEDLFEISGNENNRVWIDGGPDHDTRMGPPAYKEESIEEKDPGASY